MKCIETHEQQNSENLPFVSQTPLKLQKWTAFSSLSFLISWYLEGKEYCSILKSTFSFLAGKADGNVMKTCVLHINERLIEGNSQEERFVVVFRLLSFNSFFKNKNNNKKQSKTDPKYYSDCIWSDCLSVWIFCLIGFIFLFFSFPARSYKTLVYSSKVCCQRYRLSLEQIWQRHEKNLSRSLSDWLL